MNKELDVCEKIMHDLEGILHRLRHIDNREAVDTILNSIMDVNEFLYGIRTPQSFCDRLGNEVDDDFYYEILKWYRDASMTLEELKKYNVKIDYDFYKLMLYIKSATKEQLLEHALECLEIVFSLIGEENKRILLSSWNHSQHLWGAFDLENKIYDHITNGIIVRNLCCIL